MLIVLYFRHAESACCDSMAEIALPLDVRHRRYGHRYQQHESRQTGHPFFHLLILPHPRFHPNPCAAPSRPSRTRMARPPPHRRQGRQRRMTRAVAQQHRASRRQDTQPLYLIIPCPILLFKREPAVSAPPVAFMARPAA